MTVFGYERTLEVLTVGVLLAVYLRLVYRSYRGRPVVVENPVWLPEDFEWLAEHEMSLS